VIAAVKALYGVEGILLNLVVCSTSIKYAGMQPPQGVGKAPQEAADMPLLISGQRRMPCSIGLTCCC
jgi:hypothetical protein